MKLLLLSLLLWLAVPFGPRAQSPVPFGVWADDTGDTHIEIYRCGERLCGRVVWLREPLDANTGRPKLDQRNPNADKRTQPLHNLVVLQDLRYNPDSERWEDGQIYDPASGRTYSCYMRLSKDRLEVKGFIGFSLIGRSHYWARVR
ncbi:Uncharacterized conserved protein, DUF2147 family [Hymenobacter daecheongensis DSM 21074]|uniref:Uncharacterized conserved protein, DUF2147 family n=1 Tax=Hymenobacter daecheongensis DSM 21074 TaxID=1121955 RepID=A0A1M6JRU1_9BACT|nr:DUF2147 domain-containing protein [Hymenobacter daecheongensis]SHJ49391.1 Uncharacterized conserved protein, DUF2147 family [Hymenobacter daecheongensis DSM 21074]